MKKNSRFAGFLLSIISLISISVVSCGESNSHISLFIYSSTDTFMQGYAEQIQDTLRDKYNVVTFNGESSQTLQNDQIVEEINNDESKFLLINLVDRLAARTIIEKSATKEKPIVFLNREPLESDLSGSRLAYYVGAKPESDGSLQAEIIDEFYGGNAKFLESYDKNKNGKLDVLLIKGEQGHQDTENRSQYSINGLKDLGYDVNILDTRFCDWNRETAFSYLQEIYADYENDLDVIISNNDDMALGAIDYFKTLEDYDSSKSLYEQYPLIIGVDATEVGFEAVQNQEMYGTVQNDYEKQVAIIDELIEYLLNHIDMSTFPYKTDSGNFFRTDGIKITQENYSEFIDTPQIQWKTLQKSNIFWYFVFNYI